MSARSKVGTTASLIAALALAPALAAQEETEAEELAMTLQPRNDSGISGTAVLRDAPDAMGEPSHAVVLELTGVEAGQTYAAHIHSGTCETGGGVVTALVAVVAEGSTASATTIFTPEQIAALREAHGGMTDMARETEEEEEEEDAGEEGASLFIQVHSPDGSPAACADVPGMDHHEDGGRR